jgi:hypothetical protein
MLTLPALSVELFRYRYNAEDGKELEYVFETDEPTVGKAITREKAAEIAADWMTTFYHVRAPARAAGPKSRVWLKEVVFLG